MTYDTICEMAYELVREGLKPDSIKVSPMKADHVRHIAAFVDKLRIQDRELFVETIFGSLRLDVSWKVPDDTAYVYDSDSSHEKIA